MIETSDAYKEAIVAPVRRVRPRIQLDIQDPGLVYGTVSGSGQFVASKPKEIYDGKTAVADQYASFETNRWILDGKTVPLTTNAAGTVSTWSGESGYVTSAMCTTAAKFSSTQRFQLAISGVDILQALRINWPDSDLDGYATDFTVSVQQGGTAYYTESISGATSPVTILRGFTVYVPDLIVVTVTKWSLPGRRARLVEIFAGYSDTWDGDMIQSITVSQSAQISCMNLPYGTATVVFDNTDNLFDPRDKGSLFLSLEERQPLPIELGVDLEDGTTEYVSTGVFYQHERAWATTDSVMTMKWDLVDILGLLSTRSYEAPETLPTTLGGWVASLCGQLGDTLSGNYHVDPDYAGLSLTCDTEDVEGKNCGDILRWVCQATSTFPRADAEDGRLTVEPVWKQGRELTLDNLTDLPTLSANDNIGSIIFQLGDDLDDIVIAGNESVSATNVTVSNPFITTQAGALAAARNILITYGGNRITASGRGDMSSEVGDVSTVELKDGSGASARLVSQTLNYQNGVLSGCRSELLQPNGNLLYENVEILTTSGTWTAPSGVTELYVILVGGGQAGGHGGRGTYPTSLFFQDNSWQVGETGATGEDGSGGSVWYGTLNINDSQSFAVTIGAGGTAASSGTDPVDGGETTFGTHSSADGRVYSPAFTDINSGNSYGRSAAKTPTANRGDGGKGGAGGRAGAIHWHNNKAIDYEAPGNGSAGTSGTAGCVIIYYEL